MFYRRVAALLTAAGLAGAIALVSPRLHVSAEGLPRQLSDRAFWQMVTEFSEPTGSFPSDNLISNERTLQFVIPVLKKNTTPVGVYMGVGPDQNFTYISALAPRMAFIVDIRRQNAMLHLMYKALIEMSEDRADFLSHLFSRPRPARLDRRSTPEALFEAFTAAIPSDELFQKNLRAVDDRLVKLHGFELSEADLQSIAFVYRAFYTGGPNVRYSFPQQQNVRFPSYADLMLATDGLGHNLSYLATDQSYKVLRDMELNNLLVPLVGDFGGDKTLLRVGQYLKEHGAVVSVFYTSNVEQYLFQTDAWTRFYASIANLPIDSRSTMVRSFFNLRYRSPQDSALSPQSEMLLDPIANLIDSFHMGMVRSYNDLIQRSR